MSVRGVVLFTGWGTWLALPYRQPFLLRPYSLLLLRPYPLCFPYHRFFRHTVYCTGNSRVPLPVPVYTGGTCFLQYRVPVRVLPALYTGVRYTYAYVLLYFITRHCTYVRSEAEEAMS